jgi:tetratricopeptide (TPR) repeat protein
VSAGSSRARPTRRTRFFVLLFALPLVTGASAAAGAPPRPVARPAAAAAVAPSGNQLALAQEKLDAGDPEAALALLDPLVQREPQNAVALLLRSTAECMQGAVPPCRKDLQRALDLDPTLRQGWLNLAALHISEKEYPAALVALQRAEKLDPAAPDNALNLGAVELLAGQLQDASAHFARYLEQQAGSADALYLVASNYALAGYNALALQHLQKAIALDEKVRRRARLDPNFGDLAGSANFQVLLETDAYKPPPGSYTAQRTFRAPYDGAGGALLSSVLDALQLSGRTFDPQVEVTPDWSLVWWDLRIKVRKGEGEQGVIELSAPAHAFTPQQWRERADWLFSETERRLALREAQERRRAPAPAPSPPPG